MGFNECLIYGLSPSGPCASIILFLKHFLRWKPPSLPLHKKGVLLEQEYFIQYHFDTLHMPVFLFMLTFKSNLIPWLYFRKKLFWERWSLFFHGFSLGPRCLSSSRVWSHQSGRFVFHLVWQNWREMLPHPFDKSSKPWLQEPAMAISLLVGRWGISFLAVSIAILHIEGLGQH